MLVEGLSDARAVEALAARRGRDLAADGVVVVAIGGAQAIGNAVEVYGPRGLGLTLAALCDSGEERHFRRALERVGLGAAMELHGFYVCVEDLEDELIRSLGTEAVEEVIRARGELDAFRTLQRQPAWRGRAVEHQLRRFMGTHSGRKIEYAGLLVDALDPSRVPRPLDRVLGHV